MNNYQPQNNITLKEFTRDLQTNPQLLKLLQIAREIPEERRQAAVLQVAEFLNSRKEAEQTTNPRAE